MRITLLINSPQRRPLGFDRYRIGETMTTWLVLLYIFFLCFTFIALLCYYYYYQCALYIGAASFYAIRRIFVIYYVSVSAFVEQEFHRNHYNMNITIYSKRSFLLNVILINVYFCFNKPRGILITYLAAGILFGPARLETHFSISSVLVKQVGEPRYIVHAQPRILKSQIRWTYYTSLKSAL